MSTWGDSDDEVDAELVADTVRTARRPGYLLIGPGERVYRRDHTGRSCQSVPVHEDGWVHELIKRGVLTRAATFTISDRDNGTERAITLSVASHRGR